MKEQPSTSLWQYLGNIFMAVKTDQYQLYDLFQIQKCKDSNAFSLHLRQSVQEDQAISSTVNRHSNFLVINKGINKYTELQILQSIPYDLIKQQQEQKIIVATYRPITSVLRGVLTKLYKIQGLTLVKQYSSVKDIQQKLNVSYKMEIEKLQQYFVCLVAARVLVNANKVREWNQNFDMDLQYTKQEILSVDPNDLVNHLLQNSSNWNHKYLEQQVKRKNRYNSFPNSLFPRLQVYQGEQIQQVMDKKQKIFDLSTYNVKQTMESYDFKGQLIPYQRQALTWMLYRQGAIKQIGMDMCHSLNWKNLREKLNIKTDLFINQKYRVLLNKKPIKQCKGGIIADEMGLGKTIMMISLILYNKPTGEHIGKPTLVICPKSVVHQWEKHFTKFAPHLVVTTFEGSDRKFEKILGVDIVIITQGILLSEQNHKNNKSKRQYNGESIFEIQWFRIIVDQSQNFKNFKSKTSNALYQLSAEYRWCVSGTPAQNAYSDLYSLVKFIRYKPWWIENQWESDICDFRMKSRANNSSVKKIQEILKGIMIRRTKDSKDQNGNKLLQMTELLKLQLKVKLQQNLRKQYNFLKQLTLKKLKQLQNEEILYQKKNLDEKVQRSRIRKNIYRLTNFIMGKLTNLRQLCCHSFLYKYSNELVRYDQFIEKYDKFLAKKNLRSFKRTHQAYEKVKDIASKEKYQCQICKQIPVFGLISPCLHVYCEQCITVQARAILERETKKQIQPRTFNQDFQAQLHRRSKDKVKLKLKDIEFTCFSCRNKVKFQNMFPTPRLNHFDRDMSQFKYNQKFCMLVHGLRSLKPDEKALIYTNFIGMILLLQQTMRRQRINHQVLKGQDSSKVRAKKIQDFQQNKDVKVLLITLKTGSVGLNLQIANKVFIMDPWWNPFVEDQAISRAHRIGQKKTVQVVTFITQNTIQQRVKKLQQIKKDLFIDLMIDQRQENEEDQPEEGEKSILDIKRRRGKKLSKMQQFTILLQENEKYQKMQEQLQSQIKKQEQEDI